MGRCKPARGFYHPLHLSVKVLCSRPLSLYTRGHRTVSVGQVLEVCISMKNLFKIASVLTVGVLLVTGAFAQGKGAKKMAPKAKAAAAVNCPVCKMPLSAKMTKADPVAVRLKKGDKVMYCCSACKMPASVLVKMNKSHKGAMKKPMAKKK